MISLKAIHATQARMVAAAAPTTVSVVPLASDRFEVFHDGKLRGWTKTRREALDFASLILGSKVS